MQSLRRLFPALFLILANTAWAADIGECASPEAMTAKLKVEDQHSVVSAQLITEDKRLFGMIFTMSDDRKIGYILKADQPLGDRASRICVYNRMTNVRVFDARRPGVPSEALLNAPEDDALRHCDELAAKGKFSRDSCGSLNSDLRRVEAHGERVVLQGFLVRRDAQGRYVPDGTLATVTGRVGGSVNDYAANPARGILGAIAYSSLPDGASILNATLVYVDYTPYALSLLR
jgi:hypothetical protein